MQPEGANRGASGNGDLAIYKAVRAHELELNRATAAFEHAVLAPLYLLNGGAVVAFLTLLGAASASDSRLDIETGWAVAAMTSWALGLLAAALATWFGYRAQQGHAIAERIRRLEVEKLIGRHDVAGAASTRVSSRAQLRSAAAGDNQHRFALAIGWSVLAFLAGAALAAVAVAA